MLAKSLSDEQDDGSSEQKAEPAYVFEGFDVEFSVKVVLIPITVTRTSSSTGTPTREVA